MENEKPYFENGKWYQITKRTDDLKNYIFKYIHAGRIKRENMEQVIFIFDFSVKRSECICLGTDLQNPNLKKIDDKSTRKDGVPARYEGKGIHKIETIEAMEYVCNKFDGKQAASVAQIVKYFSRYNYKGGYRDLDAGADYIKRLTGEWK